MDKFSVDKSLSNVENLYKIYLSCQYASNKSHGGSENSLPKTVTVLRDKNTGATVYLVGTLHFSKASQQDVVQVMRHVRPHIVVLELCKNRTNILYLNEKALLQEARDINMKHIFRYMSAHGVINGIVYFLGLRMNARLTEEFGVAPGGEMRVAYHEALKIPNCQVRLGDRPFNITLQRALSKLTLWQAVKLSRPSPSLNELSRGKKLTAEDIEEYKNKDMLEQALSEFEKEAPGVYEAILTERDIYLTHSLQAAARSTGPVLKTPSEPLRIVGVVGMGHVPGIIRLWSIPQESFIKSIVTVPGPSKTSRFIKISLFALGGYWIYRKNGSADPNSDAEGVCKDSKEKFANNSAQFILCALENSRPIKLCKNCVDSYIDVVESYENMSKISFNGTSCLDRFINQDRLQIVNTMYSNTGNLWSSAKCYDCYLIENNTQTRDVSNATKQFEEYYQQYNNCITSTTEDDLCSECLKDYNTLNNYFTSISDINEKISYCMDLVDMMNDTWNFWSSNCCKFRHHDEYLFIGLSIGVVLITIAFYTISLFCDEKKAPMIIQQRRFAESINSLTHQILQ